MYIEKIINILKNKFYERERKREFNRNSELKNLYSIFRRHPESKWIIGKDDALLLYKLIKKYNPKSVLDLGTGIGASTAVIALALEGGAE